jgi:hypothetical protein
MTWNRFSASREGFLFAVVTVLIVLGFVVPAAAGTVHENCTTTTRY